jgi:hypothetical protein
MRLLVLLLVGCSTAFGTTCNGNEPSPGPPLPTGPCSGAGVQSTCDAGCRAKEGAVTENPVCPDGCCKKMGQSAAACFSVCLLDGPGCSGCENGNGPSLGPGGDIPVYQGIPSSTATHVDLGDYELYISTSNMISDKEVCTSLAWYDLEEEHGAELDDGTFRCNSMANWTGTSVPTSWANSPLGDMRARLALEDGVIHLKFAGHMPSDSEIAIMNDLRCAYYDATLDKSWHVDVKFKKGDITF